MGNEMKIKNTKNKKLITVFLLYFLTLPAVFLTSSCQTNQSVFLRSQMTKADYEKALLKEEENLNNTLISFGENSLEAANIYDKLADINLALGNFEASQKQYEKAFNIRKSKLNEDDEKIATSLKNLGTIYKRTGKLKKASSMLHKSLEITTKIKGNDTPDVASLLVNISHLYMLQNNYKLAEQRCKKALNILLMDEEKHENEIDTARAYMAEIYLEQGKFAPAEKTIKKTLEKQISTFGKNSANVGTTLGYLAQIYTKQGRYKLAENNLNHSLQILQSELGENDPKVAETLKDYTQVLIKRGKYKQAIPFIKRAQQIQERSIGSTHPDIAKTYIMLADVYHNAKMYEQALTSAENAFDIYKNIYGIQSNICASALAKIGEINLSLKNLRLAEESLKKALDISNKVSGRRHPKTALIMKSLADVYAQENLFAKAEKLYKQSAILIKGAHSENHPSVVFIYESLAKLYLKKGATPDALQNIRRATKSFINFHSITGNKEAIKNYNISKELFETYLNIIFDGIGRSPRNRIRYSEEAFRVFQTAGLIKDSQSLSKISAKFTAEPNYLGSIVREQYTLAKSYNSAEKKLTKAIELSENERSRSQEKEYRRKMKEIFSIRNSIDKTISDKFSNYKELVNPKNFSVYNLQNNLAKNEALVAYFVGDKQTYIFAVTKKDMSFTKAYINEARLKEYVKKIISGLSPSNIKNGELPAYDTALANRLYKEIFKPIEKTIKGKKEIILVPSSALKSLPFAALVTKNAQNLEDVSWLSDRYAFSIISSVSSNRALKNFRLKQSSDNLLIGFGKALEKDEKVKKSYLNIFDNFKNSHDKTDELYKISNNLNIKEPYSLIKENATEKDVRESDLSNYKIVTFASPVIMAGEFMGLEEPALIMSQSQKDALSDNDGILHASEVTSLKLNAELVILLASKTASKSGEPNLEGLSSLSKAFLYAGTRSMLISNWVEPSQASEKIITSFIESIRKSPKTSKAQALKAAMNDLRKSDGSKYMHPIFWAQFSLVGDNKKASSNLD
jgi:CHAT domain-containing protein/Tfp pilus assembly protein PilF